MVLGIAYTHHAHHFKNRVISLHVSLPPPVSKQSQWLSQVSVGGIRLDVCPVVINKSIMSVYWRELKDFYDDVSGYLTLLSIKLVNWLIDWFIHSLKFKTVAHWPSLLLIRHLTFWQMGMTLPLHRLSSAASVLVLNCIFQIGLLQMSYEAYQDLLRHCNYATRQTEDTWQSLSTHNVWLICNNSKNLAWEDFCDTLCFHNSCEIIVCHKNILSSQVFALIAYDDSHCVEWLSCIFCLSWVAR